MEKISSQSEKIKLRFKDQSTFESPSWLACQDYVRNYASKIENFSLTYLGREFCNWPSGKNYFFSKKTICFPGGSVLHYRYVGYTQNKLLIKVLYRMPEFQEIKTEMFILAEKDKDFLLCRN